MTDMTARDQKKTGWFNVRSLRSIGMTSAGGALLFLWLRWLMKTGKSEIGDGPIGEITALVWWFGFGAFTGVALASITAAAVLWIREE